MGNLIPGENLHGIDIESIYETVRKRQSYVVGSVPVFWLKCWIKEIADLEKGPNESYRSLCATGDYINLLGDT